MHGLVAPFAATLLERLSMRFVATVALLLVPAGAGLAVLMPQSWQLWVLWGGWVGVGTGAMALVFGAAVANRWFVRRRGLVMGIFSASNACGQLIFLPAVVSLTENHGWRITSLLIAGFALAIIPLLFCPFANSPTEAKTTPYGSPTPDVSTGTTSASGDSSAKTGHPPRAAPRGAIAATFSVLGQAMRDRAFWILAFTFWICGWSTNGLVQTHFIPAAHDHGMPATTASGLLALIGIFDIIGTIASGWLTDRMRPWLLLMAFYGLRGLSLFTIHALMGPTVEPVMWIFIMFYGRLDRVATVPPTVVLCRQYFGPVKATVVFGWVFAFHMVGAGVGAMTAGLTQDGRRAGNGSPLSGAGAAGSTGQGAAQLADRLVPQRPWRAAPLQRIASPDSAILSPQRRPPWGGTRRCHGTRIPPDGAPRGRHRPSPATGWPGPCPKCQARCGCHRTCGYQKAARVNPDSLEEAANTAPASTP